MTYNISVKLQDLDRITQLLEGDGYKFKVGEQLKIPYGPGSTLEGTTYTVTEILISAHWQHIDLLLHKRGFLKIHHQGITEFMFIK